jgi:hypothetical protein
LYNTERGRNRVAAEKIAAIANYTLKQRIFSQTRIDFLKKGDHSMVAMLRMG